jgi:aspartyl-tRNA(Asn)/glutamyl-tRNA(Gln) amidotransferase subunit B
VTELRDILRSLQVSDVKMEQGSMRCDVNLSLAPIGSGALGTRSETKNVNSLRSVERAVIGEVVRQANRLEAGERIVQETRHFLEESGQTRPGRSKEQAEDYRYFPEPDLVPVVPDSVWIEELRATLPEKPSIRRKRLQNEWSVPDKEMASLVNAGLLDVVEETIALGAEPARARSWWLGEISRLANEKEVDPTSLITASQVAEVIKLIESGELTDKLARQVVEGVIAGEGNPAEVIASRGLKVVSDDGALMTAIESAIAAQPDTADRVRGGNIPAAGALIGAVMKATGGQADAAKVRELLLKHLGQGE